MLCSFRSILQGILTCDNVLKGSSKKLLECHIKIVFFTWKTAPSFLSKASTYTEKHNTHVVCVHTHSFWFLPDWYRRRNRLRNSLWLQERGAESRNVKIHSAIFSQADSTDTESRAIFHNCCHVYLLQTIPSDSEHSWEPKQPPADADTHL